MNREKALQMVVFWHDQVMNVREFNIGSKIIWDWLGNEVYLGTVGGSKSSIKIPKGCAPAQGAAGAKTIEITIGEPAAFRASEALRISFRYTPKSLELARSEHWLEQRLIDPLIASSAVHGAAALTAFFMAPAPQKTTPPPDRFATIIMVDPTAPQEVAAAPSPTPTPEPLTPLPSPTPNRRQTPEEIEDEKIEVEKVVVKEKLKKVARKRNEDVGIKHREKPTIAKALPPPPKIKDPAEMTPPLKQIVMADQCSRRS